MQKQKEPSCLWAEDTITIRLKLEQALSRRFKDQAKKFALARYRRMGLTGLCSVNPVDMTDGFRAVIEEVAQDMDAFMEKVFESLRDSSGGLRVVGEGNG